MISSVSGMRFMGILGVLGLTDCVSSASPRPSAPGRGPYPEYPSPDDLLATAPCSVQKEPDIVLKNAPVDLLRPLGENLEFLRASNPVFLCGLERIDVLGDAEYRASADPRYTRRSVGLYTPEDRVIRLKGSAGITLTHEVGHHIHNLGYFASTVREFLAQSWTVDSETGSRSPRCKGPDCFLGDAAASDPKEDWARTFDYVLLRPIEIGVQTNFSFNTPTPMQEKIRLIRSIAKTPDPVKGVIRFGEARTLKESEIAIPAEPTALPASLPQDTIRRIFKVGKASIRPYVWEKRRHPFLAGDFVVFPVFQENQKTLGFFVYDLKREIFSPVVLENENLPKELREAAENFTSLEILPQQNGDLLLIGRRRGKPDLAAPVSFQF